MGTPTTNNTAETSLDVIGFIEKYLRSPEHSWSIGISGAIGEFMFDDGEQVHIEKGDNDISIVTERGAMQIHISDQVKCLAYEEPSPCTKSWSQGVAFCIPESSANLQRHSVLTELGMDANAVQKSSREMLIFDMGVDSASLQFCVRTDDDELIQTLRACCGHPIFAEGNIAAQAILEASPTRVVISSLGRIEIESRIPKNPAEIPVGPHTHLLPALLKSARSSFKGLPAGYIDALTLYPEHPAFDKYGRGKSFKKAAYQEFQNLLYRLGSESYLQEKKRVNDKLLNVSEEKSLSSENLSWQRHAERVAKLQAPLLRQS